MDEKIILEDVPAESLLKNMNLLVTFDNAFSLREVILLYTKFNIDVKPLYIFLF